MDWAELTLTNKCNQRCFFCYEEARDIAEDLKFDEIKKLIDDTRRKAELLVLCGKEVLLRKDILSVVEYAKSTGLIVAVFTNGQALKKPGFVEQLVDAGCSSIVISFHFPDENIFVRAARTNKQGFFNQLDGIRNISRYNLSHPEKPVFVSVETDMFILNLGKLNTIRRTLMEAFAKSRWEMRIGSLLPTDIYDIGLDHALAPFSKRKEELKDFIKTHPADIPLNFVKIPLCLLPEGEEHRVLDVKYIYEKTLLTCNHEKTKTVTKDVYSTSIYQDIQNGLKKHPYRWICKSCNLVSICRFGRVSWDHSFFMPDKDQKPEPFYTLTAHDVLSRIGPSTAAADYINKTNSSLRDICYPEELLLNSFKSDNPQDPRIENAWLDGDSIIIIQFKYRNESIIFDFSFQDYNQVKEPEEYVFDYLSVKLLSSGIDKKLVNDCLEFIGKQKLPELSLWKDEDRFCLPYPGKTAGASAVKSSRQPVGLRIEVTDKTEKSQYIFTVSGYAENAAYYIRTKNLMLWYSHKCMTDNSAKFARIIQLAMQKLQDQIPRKSNTRIWDRTIMEILNYTNLEEQFSYRTFWGNSSGA